MRKLVLMSLAALMLLATSGCLVPIYSPNKTRRMKQLLNSSENLRLISDEWERFWLLDQPNHGTPYRTHGGM